jgi:hypothetical protein
MKIKLTFIFWFFSFVITGTARGQKEGMKILEIGDTIPNLALSLHERDSVRHLHIRDIKTKLIIFIFWGTRCRSCIAKIPDLEKLQQAHEGEIQIILVTDDTQKEVHSLSLRSNIIRNLTLPLITNDTILSKMFPSEAYGLSVWIDHNQVIKQKTDEDNYSEKDLAEFLSGNKITIASRKDISNFEWWKPLWLEGQGRELKRIKFHSYIADHVFEDFPHGSAGYIRDSATKKVVGIKIINYSLLGLIYIAVSRFHEIGWVNSPNRIILEVKDSSKYFAPSDKTKRYSWNVENSYCYELEVPPNMSKQLFTIMRQDFERYFDLEIKIEKHLVKCIILVNRSEGSLSNNAGSELFRKSCKNPDPNLVQNIAEDLFIKNYIQPHFSSAPVINGTGANKNIHLSDFRPPENYLDLKNQLSKYGLDVIESDTILDMLVVKERTTGESRTSLN